MCVWRGGLVVRFGAVLSLVTPKARDAERVGDDAVGTIYLEFGDVGQATQALGALSGRTFDGRTVQGVFVEPGEYDAKFRPLLLP